MPLAREAYQALEDIVGPDNISDDPALLDSYAFQLRAELVRNGSKFMTRPEAVLLPATTEEIQKIVKTCNKYKVKCKAYSTGWGFNGAPAVEGVIQLDLRRMNRILEIDEKNMFAVVEPYVIGATLQAEAMKVGLNTHMIGAGSAASVLAAATSFAGAGPDSIFMGHANENLLALEWVMPTGDILTTGSLATGDGWFCAEGPGPSLRGLAKGASGARGGLGVFTKCALKLYPWPGPPVMPVAGTMPAYRSPLPPNLRAFTVVFPTWDAYTEAYYKLYDSEIGYIVHRQYNLWGEDLGPAIVMMYADPEKTIDDLEEILAKPETQHLTEELRRSFQIVLAGMTPRDIAYQEKVLDQILAETGGKKSDRMCEPHMEQFTLLYLIKLCFKNLNFVFGGGQYGSFHQWGSPDFVISKVRPAAVEVMAKHVKRGHVVDTGPDAMMAAVGSGGGGGDTCFEQMYYYDPHDLESVKGVQEYLRDAARTAHDHGLPAGLEIGIVETAKDAPKLAIHIWQQKIKEAFDPNGVGDGSYGAREF